jgi:hypothetical protein
MPHLAAEDSVIRAAPPDRGHAAQARWRANIILLSLPARNIGKLRDLEEPVQIATGYGKREPWPVLRQTGEIQDLCKPDYYADDNV